MRIFGPAPTFSSQVNKVQDLQLQIKTDSEEKNIGPDVRVGCILTIFERG